MKIYRYFTLNRPPMLGGIPKHNIVRLEAYQEPVRNPIRGNVWGFVDYSVKLPFKDETDHELSYVGEFEE